MHDWELAVNSVSTTEKTGIARVFSVDVGYLENIGGRFRIVLLGWALEVYGPVRSGDSR